MKFIKDDDTNNNVEDSDADDNDNSDKRQVMIALAYFVILKMSHSSTDNKLHEVYVTISV